MSLLELGGRRFTIPVGEVVLGSDAGCAIPLSGAGVLPRHALVQGQADGQVVIRKVSPAAEVLINGVRLGAEPTPLLHGDKVEVGEHELTFVDERRSGSTQFIPALATPGAASPKPAAKPAGIGVSGGRVVSLTDGREYVIAGQALVFGREAGSDVVVSGKDVSRRHAEIVPTARGYMLVDSSTNGTFVNEERIEGQRVLARADVIRVGEEQFRFYADVATTPTIPTAAPPPQPSEPAVTRQPVPKAPPAGGAQRHEQLKHTVHGLDAQASAPPPPRPAAGGGGGFGSLLARSGELAGQRLVVKSPIVNIGRADYNDIVIPDPSVSTSHAKLQRREGVWVLVDLDSTNGTFVDGERVRGEAALAPGAQVRLGDVQLVFEPADDARAAPVGGGTQLLRTPHSLAPSAPGTPRGAPPARPQSAPPPPPPPAAPAPHAAPPAAHPAAAPAGAPPARPGSKPAARRPAAQQPPPKKGKGCGASAALFVLGGATVVALLYRVLS